MRSRDDKVRNLITEQAAEWHVMQSAAELSPQQARAFMRWLRMSPFHVAEYLAITSVANDLSGAARESTASLHDLLAEEGVSVRPMRPASEGGFRPGEARPRRAPRRPTLRWAAAIAVLVAVAVSSLAGWHWFGSRSDVESFATRRGEDRSLQLPDKTFLQMGPHSAITVRFDQKHRRVVVDYGQVYFRVIKDSGRPFSVRVGPSLIRDIGTAFSVYRHASRTTVTVAQGHVQVWSAPQRPDEIERWLLRSSKQPGGKLLAALGPGEQARMTDSQQAASLSKVNAQRVLAWRHGRIEFDHESIASVAGEFNRYNDVDITVADPRIGQLPISGVLDLHDVSAFVAFLRRLPNVSVEEQGQHIAVHAAVQAGQAHRD